MARALVLGGGGPVGVAWEIGLTAGFAQGGVDLAAADFILGTSAGAIVGAQLASGADAQVLAELVLREADQPPSAAAAPPYSPEALAKLPEIFGQAQNGRGNPAEARAQIGAYAMQAPTETEAAYLDRVRSWTKLGEWPKTNFACAVVDAEDGGFNLIGGADGADLTAAVAASCSVPGLSPPVNVAGRRYMDGGLRSQTNADLAAGYDLIVIVAVLPTGPQGERMAERLDDAVAQLQAGGSVVITITPDDAGLEAVGRNLMDVARRPRVARAAVAQGLAQAAVLKDYWT